MYANSSLLKGAAAAALAIVLTGCPSSDPTPPTIENAKTMWHTLNTRSGLDSAIALVDMTKTDGQMAEVNGVKVYTLFYEAKERHLSPMGFWKPGQVETIRSNYGFQRTEKGWQGGDGEVFEH